MVQGKKSGVATCHVHSTPRAGVCDGPSVRVVCRWVFPPAHARGFACSLGEAGRDVGMNALEHVELPQQSVGVVGARPPPTRVVDGSHRRRRPLQAHAMVRRINPPGASSHGSILRQLWLGRGPMWLGRGATNAILSRRYGTPCNPSLPVREKPAPFTSRPHILTHARARTSPSCDCQNSASQPNALVAAAASGSLQLVCV